MHPLFYEIKKALAGHYPETETSALAKMLLVEKFGFTTLELFGGKDKEVFKKDLDVLNEMLGRLQNNEPIQYIIGHEIFCGLTFEVNHHVLIPRPETQELVDWIVNDVKGGSACRILDVGTGSGCIAVSLAKLISSAEVEAWDISDGALEIARRNAELNHVTINFQLRNALDAEIPFPSYEIIVSNPPYITEKEKKDMESNVLEWEPHTALFVPDTDPLLFYRKIAQMGVNALVKGGALYFEINRAYGEETMKMLDVLGYQQIELKKDMFGNDRMIKAIKP